MMLNRIRFAVVGHPNKGKSSIVASLAENESIEIAPRSGTTTHNQSLRVETPHSGFEIIDTPGFQRPSRLLRQLQQKAPSAAQRQQALRDFFAKPENRQSFPDESQLLEPLLHGAAVLYVVDGSRPYGAEYEAEMEILRWTGAPSIGLINPIGGEQHLSEWQQALEQFFKVVRVFNPMQAALHKKRELFEALTILRPEWKAQVSELLADLKEQQQARQRQSAALLAELLVQTCRYQVSQKVLSKDQAKSLEPLLKSQWQEAIRKMESRALEQLKQIWNHHQVALESRAPELPFELFDTKQWFAWGLNRQQLTAASAVAGAVGGAAIDAMLAGHSFLLGALGGSLLGAGSAWFGSDVLVRQKIRQLPLGGYAAVYGPVNHLNFPYVLVSRYLWVYRQLVARSHAVRSQPISVPELTAEAWLSQLQKDNRGQLERALARLIKGKSVDHLHACLLPLFH